MELVVSRANRRNGRRWNVNWPATLVVDGQRFGCTILDLSHSGALLDCYGLRMQPVKVALQCEHFGALEARLQWVRGAQTGIRFEHTATEVIEMLKNAVPGMGRRDMPVRQRRATFGRLRGPAAA